MSRSAPIRPVIVDDHPIVRRGVTYALRVFDDIELVGEAECGKDALSLCGRLQPDVVLMDIMMPGMDGVAATRAVLRERYPGIQVLALTSFSEPDLVRAALRAGACGYLLKDITIDELAQAIRMAQAGHSVLAQAVAQVLVNDPEPESRPSVDLTERQREVLALVAAGLSNQRIAKELMISHATARTHVSIILAKLGVVNRAEAAAVATRYNLLKPSAVPARWPAAYAGIPC